VHLLGGWPWTEVKPLWLMTDLEPEQAPGYYRHRMKIEKSRGAGDEQAAGVDGEGAGVGAVGLCDCAVGWRAAAGCVVLKGGRSGFGGRCRAVAFASGQVAMLWWCFCLVKGAGVAFVGELRTGGQTGCGGFCLLCHACCPNSCLSFIYRLDIFVHARYILKKYNAFCQTAYMAVTATSKSLQT